MVAINLKEFANEWILFGLLFISLMTFTVVFMANNNQDGLGNFDTKFSGVTLDSQSKLTVIENDSNSLLNILSQNNPEVSDQGSKDSVATSFGIFGSAKIFFTTFKQFLGWMFVGTMGQVIIGVITGIFGITSGYFIYRWIRGA